MRRSVSLFIPGILLSILLGGSVIIMLIAGMAAPKAPMRAIAVLKTIDVNMEFWEVVKTGMRTAAKEFDVELEIRGPQMESDVQGQIKIMEDAIAERPKVIILAAADFSDLVGSVENAKKKGIRVITIDSGVNSSIPETFVATNNIEAGEKMGVEMAHRATEGKEIALVNHIKGATTAIEREEGALRAIKKDGRFKILDTRYTNNIEENAYGITLELLETHRNLGGIMAMNEVSTVGVARALRDKKRSDVRLVGFDNSLFEVKLIEEGIIDATVIQQPFNMGYLAVRAARTANTGKRLEPFIDTGSLLITVDNMYHPEIQKSLFPFAEREARQ